MLVADYFELKEWKFATNENFFKCNMLNSLKGFQIQFEIIYVSLGLNVF